MNYKHALLKAADEQDRKKIKSIFNEMNRLIEHAESSKKEKMAEEYQQIINEVKEHVQHQMDELEYFLVKQTNKKRVNEIYSKY